MCILRIAREGAFCSPTRSWVQGRPFSGDSFDILTNCHLSVPLFAGHNLHPCRTSFRGRERGWRAERRTRGFPAGVRLSRREQEERESPSRHGSERNLKDALNVKPWGVPGVVCAYMNVIFCVSLSTWSNEPT